MNARLTFVHAYSRLHAGIGQGAGVIDLPIAREKATGLPYLPGSSLKGALRSRSKMMEETQKYSARLFGPENPGEDNNPASQAQFSDQRLLLMPIRSLAGTFAWVTSPYVLRRFIRDAADVSTASLPQTIPTVAKLDECLMPAGGSDLTFAGSSKVYLEDLDLKAPAQPGTGVDAWADWLARCIFPRDADFLRRRFCLVHDNVFNYLIDTATEVIARIRLREDVKTVQDGGLWYEEALPAETILSGVVLATPTRNGNAMKSEDIFSVLRTLTATTLQLGGKATVGNGMCRVLLTAGEAENEKENR